MQQGLSTGYRFSSAGAVAMLVCFFMPWVLVSCGTQPIITLTGSTMLTGTEIGGGLDPLEGNPLYAIVPLVSTGTLILAGLAMRRSGLQPIDRYGVALLGGIALLFMFYSGYTFASAESRMAEQEMGGIVTFRIEYGFWGSLIGTLLVLGGGIVNARESSAAQQPSAALEEVLTD